MSVKFVQLFQFYFILALLTFLPGASNSVPITNTEMITKAKGFKNDSTVNHISRRLRANLLNEIEESISRFKDNFAKMKERAKTKITDLGGIIDKVLPKMKAELDIKIGKLKSRENLHV